MGLSSYVIFVIDLYILKVRRRTIGVSGLRSLFDACCLTYPVAGHLTIWVSLPEPSTPIE